jgi:hypothetical protein
MARMILASWVCKDMVLLWCGGVIASGGHVVVKSTRVDDMRGSMMNHVIHYYI